MPESDCRLIRTAPCGGPMRTIVSLFLIVILGLFSAGCSRTHDPSPSVSVTAPTPSLTATPTLPDPTATPVLQATPTPEMIGPDAWALSPGDEEILAETELMENNLLYAEKGGFHTTVYKRNLQSGSRENLYEFDENLEVEDSENHWLSLPPEISLSPDKKILAFIDKEGLKTFHLQTKEIKTLIRMFSDRLPDSELSPGASDLSSEIPPKWSVPSLNEYAFYLLMPSWSPNGKYIGFHEVEYEGSCLGMVHFETGTYIEGIAYAPITSFRWAQTGDSYVIASSSEQDMGPNGLFVSNQGNGKEIREISAEFEEIDSLSCLDACYSPDGKDIAFVYDSWLIGEESFMGLAVSTTEGKDLTRLIEGKSLYDPFYDSTGQFIYCFQKKENRDVLVRYDLQKNQTADVIVMPEDYSIHDDAQWTKEGYLMLSVLVGNKNNDSAPYCSRFVILDLENSRVIYAGPLLGRHIKYDSLLH